jgi:hypothetical protein
MTKEREQYLDQMRRSMREIAKKYYDNQPTEVAPVETPAIPRPPKSAPVTKSQATIIAEAPTRPEVVVTKEVTVAEILDKAIPKTVASMLGQTFASVKVLSYNASESLIPRGEKQKPLPHVDCECLKCGTKFVVNAYRVSGGSQKSCGCDSPRKKTA